MKGSVAVVTCTVLALLTCYTSPAVIRTIDISGYDSGGNFLGLAVDPADHHIFLTGLGYTGGPTLWEFAPNGTLLSAIRPAVQQPGDAILSIVVGSNSHLLLSVVNGQQWKVMEINRAGTVVYSSFSPGGAMTNAVVGSYDAAAGKLFLYYFNTRTVFETTTVGSLLDSINVGLPGEVLYDVAYDPVTQNLYGAYLPPDESLFFLAQFGQYGQDKWKPFQFFDLSSTGLSTTFSLDVDSSTGLFYIQDMRKIVSFSLGDLTKFNGQIKDLVASTPN